MEQTITRFYDALRKNQWNISRQSTCPDGLPGHIHRRYQNLPAEWVDFLNHVSVCVNSDETAWFLCLDDFNKQDDGTFRWDELERLSLQAAMDDHDAEWQCSITDFWDHHLPIYLSVKDGYEYYAIRISDGAVVHGAEPEFEQTEDIAPSFAQFIELVCTGGHRLSGC